jgi:hypothetical protein
MDKIETLYHTFVEDICKVFPEYKERLETPDDLQSVLKEFLRNLKKHVDPISNRDGTIFQNDPILIPNISFKMMWNANISIQTKKTIWKYLQTFCVLMITAESEEQMTDVIQQIEGGEKVKDKKTVSKMKLLKKLNASIEENSVTQENVSSEMEDMGKMFENTGIGRIAKEITDELDIENMMKDGGGGLESIMNPNTMSKLFQSISTKMGDMGGDGSTDLVSEASNICETMKGNPMFESIMGMQQSMMGNMNPNPAGYPDTSHNSSKTRERLQKKLQQKQQSNDNQ